MFTRKTTRHTLRAGLPTLTLAVLATLNVVGCGGDDSSSSDADTTTATGGSGPGGSGGSTAASTSGSGGSGGGAGDSAGGGAGEGPGPAEGPAFVLGTRVWDDVTITSYFHVVGSLEAGTEIDESRAMEQAGAAKLVALSDIGWFGLHSGEEPLVTRYTLDDHNRLVQGESMSFLNYGVEGLWDTHYVVSATKAYYADRAGEQLIIWNPSEMRVLGTIPLPETEREGYLALYGYAPIVRGNSLLISVGWFDWEESDSVLGETGLVEIDTESDSVVGFEVDDRCGGVTQPITLPSGDTLLANSALAAVAHRLDRLPTTPCALRVRDGETAFDAEYLGELDALTDFDIVGEPIPAGGSAVFLRAFDDSLADVVEDGFTYDTTAKVAWRWLRWDVATDEVETVSELEPATGDVVWFRTDGHVYGMQTTETYDKSTLVDLTAAGGPEPALVAPGFLHGVARVR